MEGWKSGESVSRFHPFPFPSVPPTFSDNKAWKEVSETFQSNDAIGGFMLWQTIQRKFCQT
jgi:hypothetical protein